MPWTEITRPDYDRRALGHSSHQSEGQPPTPQEKWLRYFESDSKG